MARKAEQLASGSATHPVHPRPALRFSPADRETVRVLPARCARAILTLWAMTWETLRLHHPDICALAEDRGLVRDKPA
jgi:hypothetical protein